MLLAPSPPCLVRAALVVALAGWPSVAAAQAEATSDATSARESDARRFFTAARKAFDEGRFADAARAFEEAVRLKPHPAPLINAGDAWQKAGEYANAARAFQRVLKMPQATEQDRIDATDRLALLQPKLGIIELIGAETVRARVGDEEFLGGDRIFVFPGEYVVVLVDVPNSQVRTLTLKAGTSRSVDLDSLRPVGSQSGTGPGSPSPGGPTGPGDGGTTSGGKIQATTWLAYGIGALGVAGTVIFGLGVNSAESDFNGALDDRDKDAAQDAFDRFEQNKLLTNVSLAVGVLGVGLGTFFLVSDLSSGGPKADAGKAPSPQPRVSVSVGPSGVAFVGGTRF